MGGADAKRAPEIRFGPEAPGWRQRHEATKAHEQLQRLYLRTRGRGSAWAGLANLLDALEPWSDSDWQRLAEEGREWVVAYRLPEREESNELRTDAGVTQAGTEQEHKSTPEQDQTG